MSEDLRVVAFMRAKQDEAEAVRSAVLACVRPSREEDGCLGYDAHTDADDPALFVVVEHWANADLRERHLRSGHFKALTQAVDGENRLSEHHFHVLRPIT